MPRMSYAYMSYMARTLPGVRIRHGLRRGPPGPRRRSRSGRLSRQGPGASKVVEDDLPWVVSGPGSGLDLTGTRTDAASPTLCPPRRRKQKPPRRAASVSVGRGSVDQSSFTTARMIPVWAMIAPNIHFRISAFTSPNSAFVAMVPSLSVTARTSALSSFTSAIRLLGLHLAEVRFGRQFGSVGGCDPLDNCPRQPLVGSGLPKFLAERQRVYLQCMCHGQSFHSLFRASGPSARLSSVMEKRGDRSRAARMRRAEGPCP